ncbi:MAG: hypothetical protein OHK0013_36840 [Sandaracinaceae bacterium]
MSASSPATGPSRFTAFVTVGALAAAGVGAYLRAARQAPVEPAHSSDGALRADEAPLPAPLPLPSRIDAIVVGGGSSPETNQVSLEEDVRLATDTFGEAHTVRLFAGGPGTRAVQVEGLGARGDALRVEIGELLAPRGGRMSRYRPTSLPLHGAGTLAQFEAVLDLALGQEGAPLLVYLAGHGDRGESPSESRTLFWGGDALDAVALAEWLDARTPARPVRFVVTSCFSGGLAEIAFVGADRTRGPSAQERCGLFATSWDEEASGCDPDPVRAHHDGFGVHFLMALGGRDREGVDRRAEIDLDGDGVVGLYEALTHARIGSRSIDVPTTTSEVFLRAVAPPDGPRAPYDMPEQRAVIEALTEAMALDGREELVRRLDETSARRAEHDEAMEAALATADQHYYEVVAEVLSRWPVLDDPFHPDFEATFSGERGAIARYLETSPTVTRWAEAQDEVEAMSSTDLALRLELSLLRRLDDAYQTVVLAERLHARGGPDWEHYLALRACEWGAP